MDLSANGQAQATADPERMRRERQKTKQQRDLEKERKLRLNQTGIAEPPVRSGSRKRRETRQGETARTKDKSPRRELTKEEDDGESARMDPGTERQPLLGSRSKSKGRSGDGKSSNAAEKVKPTPSQDKSSKKRSDKRSKSKKKSDPKKETPTPRINNFLSGGPSSLATLPDPSRTETGLKPSKKTSESASEEDEDDSMEAVSPPVIPQRHQVYGGGLGTAGAHTTDQGPQTVQGLIARHTKSLKSSRKTDRKPKYEELADGAGADAGENERPLSGRSRASRRSRSRQSQQALIQKMRESMRESSKRMRKDKMKKDLGGELADQMR